MGSAAWILLATCIPNIFITAILLKITPHGLAWRANTVTVSHMLQALDLGLDENVISLVRISKSPKHHARLSYCLARFDKTSAEHLAAHFMPQPRSHPTMLPFELFTLNPAINEVIDRSLESYRPGSLMPLYEGDAHMIMTREQLATILKHQGDPVRYLSGRKLIWWAEELQIARIAELGSIPYDREVYGAKLKVLGDALTSISVLYDAAVMREAVAVVLSQWHEALDPNKYHPLEHHVHSYIKSEPWLASYQAIVNFVESLYPGGGMRTRRLLWIGKALTCLIYHPHTEAAGKITQAKLFLSNNHLSHIPRSTIIGIRSQLHEKGLYIVLHPEDDARTRAQFTSMDHLLPIGPRAWGMREDFFSAWHEILRYYGRVIPWILACKTCTVGQLLTWWSEYEGDVVDSILIDPTTIEPFWIVSDARPALPAVMCGDITCALRAITEEAVKLLESRSDNLIDCATDALSRIALRTIAANLLYRHWPGSGRFDQLVLRAYENEPLRSSSRDDVIVRGLRDIKIDYIPKQLLFEAVGADREAKTV